MKIKPTYWKLLLQIKLIYKTINTEIENLIIDNDFKVYKSKVINLPDDCSAIIRFNPNRNEFFEVIFSDNFPKKLKKIFSLYLGYILVDKNAEIPYTCVHLAQTFDGKIATINGKSKWIGNQQNLIHAHRIRALVDAILIGGNTFRIDNPRLDVRLVEGLNPIKVIISNSKLELEHLIKGKTFLVSYNDLKYENLPSEIEAFNFENDKKSIDSNILLEVLKAKGINSILIEGGAQTISCFLKEKTLKRIEFHMAPMLFGSGKNSIELDDIFELDDAIFLKNTKYYKMGNAIMTVSNL